MTLEIIKYDEREKDRNIGITRQEKKNTLRQTTSALSMPVDVSQATLPQLKPGHYLMSTKQSTETH